MVLSFQSIPPSITDFNRTNNKRKNQTKLFLLFSYVIKSDKNIFFDEYHGVYIIVINFNRAKNSIEPLFYFLSTNCVIKLNIKWFLVFNQDMYMYNCTRIQWRK